MVGKKATKIVSIRVTPEYHQELKSYLASKGVTLQDYIVELINKDRESEKNKKGNN